MDYILTNYEAVVSHAVFDEVRLLIHVFIFS